MSPEIIVLFPRIEIITFPALSSAFPSRDQSLTASADQALCVTTLSYYSSGHSDILHLSELKIWISIWICCCSLVTADFGNSLSHPSLCKHLGDVFSLRVAKLSFHHLYFRLCSFFIKPSYDVHRCWCCSRVATKHSGLHVYSVNSSYTKIYTLPICLIRPLWKHFFNISYW